jgi:uncharacterized protein YbjT (DUF2867 family)
MILVTGSTGLIGSEVVRLLSQAGVPARALVRSRSPQPELPGVTPVIGDLAKPETLPSAFAGCATLFLLTGDGEEAATLQDHAIVAAREAGITRVVKLSAFGASAHSNSRVGRLHYQVERELQETQLAWTMLRPHHFMQNLLSQADNIIDEGVVYSSSGDGRIPFVDTRDIAAVAVVTLTQPGHTGKKYVVTGSEALSYRQATESSPRRSAGHCASSTNPSTGRARVSPEPASRRGWWTVFSRSRRTSARAARPRRSRASSPI